MKTTTNNIHLALALFLFASATGIVNGAPGDLIVPATSGHIVRVPLNPVGTPSYVWNNANLPAHSWTGIAFDQAGNLYASDNQDYQPGAGRIYKLPPDRTTLTLFATGLSDPEGLAVDTAGNLYAAEADSGNVYKFTPEGVRTTFFTAYGASAIVFDSQGYLLIPRAGFTDCNNCPEFTKIYKVDPQGVGSVSYVLPPSWGANGMAFDSGGNLWVVSHNGFSGHNAVFVNPQYLQQDGNQCDYYYGPGSRGLAIDIGVFPNKIYIGGPGPRIHPACSLEGGFSLSDWIPGSAAGQLAIEPPAYAAQVQPPINADGTSIFTARRGVVSVRFGLTGALQPCPLPPATIAVTRTGGGVTGNVNESVYTASVDTGSNFRISGCQYMYNLNASALGVGVYRVDIKIFGGTVGSAIFELR